MNSDAPEAWVVDGYVDEPACLGVSPYISPNIRAVAGVCTEAGYRVRYLTIDQLRADSSLFGPLDRSALVVMVAGVTVPGTYFAGTPATLTEIRQVAATLRGPMTVLGGPVTFGYSPGGGEAAVRQAISGFDHRLEGDVPAALASLLAGGRPEGTLSYPEFSRRLIAGSGIITEHPRFPWLICEIETARGCARAVTGGCSFCTEPFYGLPQYRSAADVHAEIAALAGHGAVHFRLGRQPDILAYGTKGNGEYPAPDAGALEELFAGIREAAPHLKTLHIDNVNPGTIARNPDAAREALAVIVRYHTAGDVAAFGMETADPAVVAANNLKADAAMVMDAVRIVNEVGGVRDRGVPHLLPGLNFVCGLAGETDETYDKNEAFLNGLLASGLLVRRVNIRQLMPFEGTKAWDENTLGEHDARFRAFREHVRETFDVPMLQKVFPAGTLLRDIYVEECGRVSFGRQMGSYPILTGMPLEITEGTVLDAVICDHGRRSVTALPVPVRVNTLPAAALRYIPGIGKKRAVSIIAKRPFASLDAFREIAGETALDPYLIL
ncbi:radical SAM protein [Methanogenium sp. S4BF]|uniref:radical SAM protein n=1 Tax=Methanogenium sp. S4BF TaxID=1789226 RepID=UPI0024164232|nr:radical SAM protein [Methanogenium sp. S4BF]WFN33768.1 radical SAM protein [Methanogenium sp. S4BF]